MKPISLVVISTFVFACNAQQSLTNSGGGHVIGEAKGGTISVATGGSISSQGGNVEAAGGTPSGQGGATNSTGGTTAVSGGMISTGVCVPPVVVTTPAEFIAFANLTKWTYFGPYSSKRLPISDDVQVKGTIDISGKDLMLPSSCADCSPEVEFALRNMKGVTCLKTTSVGTCAQMRIADVTLRLRGVIQDWHPGQYSFRPTIELNQSCQAPCPAETFRCPTDNTCMESYNVYCRTCLQKSNEMCACQTPGGPQKNGEACYFPVSGDVICDGQCNAGVCQYTGTPGWAGCP